MHPIETGNWLLIGLGVVMMVGGPYFAIRTAMTEIRAKKFNAEHTYQFGSSGFNIVVGILLFLAGYLFIVNNLRGNPLA